MIHTPALPMPYLANSSNEILKYVKHYYLLQYAAEIMESMSEIPEKI
jgi:hypothetical protein